MRLTMEEIFRPLSNEEESGPITLAELIVMTGLSAPAIEGLENLGLLMPTIVPEGRIQSQYRWQTHACLCRLCNQVEVTGSGAESSDNANRFRTARRCLGRF